MLLVAFVAGGLIFMLLQSLNVISTSGRSLPFFTSYVRLFNDPLFYSSLLFTTIIATISTALALVVGIASALVIRKYLAHSTITKLIYQFPISVPHLVVAVVLLLFASQSGILSRILYITGLISQPYQFPELVYDKWGIGIIGVYLIKEIPFIGIITLSALQSLGKDFESMARSLGATPMQTFRHVLLPLLTPTVVPASIIVFAFTFGSYEVPFFIGGSYPSTISVLAYRYFTNPDLALRPVALALNMCMLGVVLLLAIFYIRVVFQWKQRSRI